MCQHVRFSIVLYFLVLGYIGPTYAANDRLLGQGYVNNTVAESRTFSQNKWLVSDDGYIICPGVFRDYGNGPRCRVKRPGISGFIGNMDDAEAIPVKQFIESETQRETVIHKTDIGNRTRDLRVYYSLGNPIAKPITQKNPMVIKTNASDNTISNVTVKKWLILIVLVLSAIEMAFLAIADKPLSPGRRNQSINDDDNSPVNRKMR